MVDFARVQTILRDAITAWRNQRGGAAPNLATHDVGSPTPSFPPLEGNYTKADLLRAIARGRQLIQPEVIGKTPPKGAEANLVVAIRKGFSPPDPPPFARRMPAGGPFIPDAQIQEIEDWINAGCPD